MGKKTGMYHVGDTGVPQLRIGNFTIIRQSENSIWIQDGECEGAEFSESDIEKVIKDFFNKAF